MSEAKVKWGILGAGNIANAFAEGVLDSETGVLQAIGSRSLEKAEAFAAKHRVATAHGSYEALLADSDVDAVYIATPHPEHKKWCVKAAEAGKHILCEKPIALNGIDTQHIIEAAEKNDVFLMEAFMYRCHPQTQRVIELIQEDVIGDIKFIEAGFSFHCSFNPESRLLNNALGGGGILDVGCYPVSMARLIAGVAHGKDFAEPTIVNGLGHIGESNVDEYASCQLEFPGGIIANLYTGVQLAGENKVRIYGSKGRIEIPEPWIISKYGGESEIIIHVKGEDVEKEVIKSDRLLYGIEADRVAAHLSDRQATSPAMSWADTQGNMDTLDKWREAIGLEYEAEKPENLVTKDGEPLKVKEDIIPKAQIPGLDKPVSKLVMGVAWSSGHDHTHAMCDTFFEYGGNAFDTAFVYGGGKMEEYLGQWVKNRGVRDDVVILDKGAHTPHCFPEKIGEEFEISLNRLQMDSVDIYMMHRDNLDVPVGEFVVAMNDLVKQGKFKVFGGSNWTKERIDEANAYADANGLQRMQTMSNQMGLAEMVDPVWAGCISASSKDYRAWSEEKQMIHMPWSSQSRGFFTGRAHPDRHEDAELVRCWYSDSNFKRLARAEELAEKKGVHAINIALAWVLKQPYPVFPLIGPLRVREIRTSLPGLDVELTPEEMAWLNLESD